MKNTTLKKEIFFNKPSLVLRVKATMIDAILVIILMYLFSIVLNHLDIESGLIRGVCLALAFLYEPILVSKNRTIGQKIMGLKVANYRTFTDLDSTNDISILSSLFRYAVKIVLGWISLLTIHSDKYGQALHDKMANSIVLKK